MDYPLENLGPERFQEFCQALLVKEYPNVQCFPVAQPDGGRDAISYLAESQGGKFIVFQVKYSRRPHAETEPHKWLLAIMEDEKQKLKRLIPRRASRFCLMTNIPGTAHLDSGAIDRLNASMTAELTVPFTCWWRDDLNRRLDGAWALKWVYPELLTGPDFLRVITDIGLTESRERRVAAIRAFIAQQYQTDEQVRFKQVELQNDLLDLFVDVPVGFRDQDADLRQVRLFHGIASTLSAPTPDTDEQETVFVSANYEHRYVHRYEEIEAATLLLDATFQARFPHIVLEGAPGQGKSTIAQYVCQTHRIRLIGGEEVQRRLRPEHRDKAVRLPIKVDLRDFAAWLDRKDPFGAQESGEPPVGWRKSLEAFLAALISAQSGGTNFTTDDLLALFRISSVLCVFDGLDEVADIAKRHQVVDEITKGVQRIEVNAASLQTVVTSRPAAFANSPGMPPEKYPYLHLADLSPRLIDQYADRWLRARRVDIKESTEFKKTLRQKLDLPHLRDLARNPMQLAILLSLISTRGTSLPDKRTALYDNYIDLFFNREAEKSSVVREHRELLIDIHRYLAWLLHSEAERGNPRGSISQDRLQSVLRKYLASEGYDPTWAHDLFAGMVERVVALVSRVEGTFEFEVQPLREYFAARFLYDTAPYSPPGGEQRGTKPDRFDALARNFYWTNVTRFYAGCFSKGELPGLVERLQELASSEGFRLTTHPRMLAATLLADWVFTQNPRCVQAVVELILDGIGLRYLVASGSGRRRRGLWNPVVLPQKCGHDQLVTACFSILSGHPAPDYALDVIELLRANCSTEELTDLWAESFDTSKAGRWLKYGLHMGVLSAIDIGRLERFIAGQEEASSRLLYRARRLDFIEASDDRFDDAVNGILDGRLAALPQRRIDSALDALAHAVSPSRYGPALRERVPVPLSNLIQHTNGPASLMWASDLVTNTERFRNHKNCISFAAVAENESARSAAEWAVELEPWSNLVEHGRAIWGDRWAFCCLANLAAGIKSNQERGKDATELLDHSKPLCPRTRHARQRSASRTWWQKQFCTAATDYERMLVCLVALSWARPRILVALFEELDKLLGKLCDEQWSLMIRAVRRAIGWGYGRMEKRVSAFEIDVLPRSLSPRTVAALGTRAAPATARRLYLKFLAGTSTTDEVVLEFVQREALDVVRFGTKEWSPDLNRIQECYASGAISLGHQIGFGSPRAAMPINVARAIAGSPDRFPTALLSIAEDVCRRQVAKTAKPVATIAEKEGWLSQPRPRRISDTR